ncbi:MAG TPA: hypothetical protein VF510_16380 [Ktedonobacterales bacterium]
MSNMANPDGMNQASARARATAGPSVIRRPGVVTFAAIMLFILGGFEAVWAIVEFANAAWIAGTTYGTFGGTLWLWAILDLVFAALAFYAGYDILRGGSFGQFFGIGIAAFSAFRWFFYIPAAPFMAVVIIAIDLIVIYGLTAHSDYFDQASAM